MFESTVVVSLLVGLVVFGLLVYFVHRYATQSKSVADALVADEEKVANTVEGWFHKPANTTPVVNATPVVVTPVVVTTANTIVK